MKAILDANRCIERCGLTRQNNNITVAYQFDVGGA